VTRFLGEGGKKKVYLAHDIKLDRDVAFAVIKTDGLNRWLRRRRIRPIWLFHSARIATPCAAMQRKSM